MFFFGFLKMDDAWKKVYEDNASKNLPNHAISCWSEEGFRELFNFTFFLAKKLKNVKTVLDIGCGPGAYCAEFHRKGYSCVGVDYSKKVIDLASKNHPEIKFLEADAYNLPFSNSSFDLVLCIGVLQCVYHPEKVIKELTRVSGKYVILSTLYRRQKLENPERLLKKKLETDSWPTRDYHPSELEVLFEKRGFNVSIFTKNKNSLLKDGFFVIATKK